MNDACESRQFDQSLLISPKTSNMCEINRASALAFRAIGNSRSAAAKCLSFLNLKPVYTWHKHTRVNEEKVKDLAEIDFRNAVSEPKLLKRATGHVEAGRDKELEEKEVDIGTGSNLNRKAIWTISLYTQGRDLKLRSLVRDYKGI